MFKYRTTKPYEDSIQNAENHQDLHCDTAEMRGINKKMFLIPVLCTA